MEDKYIGISMLSQYYYCKRRAGLLLLEKDFQDNIYTIKGNQLHQKVHQQKIERRKKFIKVFELNVYSKILNLNGYCDVVEFNEIENGVYIPFLNNKYDIYPIEFKNGVKRDELEYNIQLCAQAMCMEEMFKCHISSGAIYYADSNTRVNVDFTSQLRELVEKGCFELQIILEKQTVPKSKLMKKCRNCSMKEKCNPGLPDTKEYIDNLWKGKY